MSKYDFDLFVIGAGSGGVRGARRAAEAGAKVAIAECGALGGTCVNVGCVPKKLFVYASQFQHDFQHAADFGWSMQPPAFDWQTLLTNKNREIQRLNTVYESLLQKAGVKLLRGRGKLLDSNTIEVAGNNYSCRYILIATGSAPTRPNIPGAEHGIVSDDAFYFEELPKRMIIVGGGYIAVEFAGIFHPLGVAVTQLYRREMFLRGFDDDLRSHLAMAMKDRGVDLRFQTNITQIEKHGDELHCTLTDGSTMEVDTVFFATGRRPLTDSLGLASANVKCDADGAIQVDEYSQTSTPNIYAVGDVTNRMNLTPVAIAEASAVVRTLFHDDPTTMDYQNIPTAVFSQPTIGTVGLTESQANAEYENVSVYKSSFRPMKHTLGDDAEKTLMKIIVDDATDRVIGAHMIGPDAGEIMQGIAIAMQCGATKANFDKTIGIHPTAAEEWTTM